MQDRPRTERSARANMRRLGSLLLCGLVLTGCRSTPPESEPAGFLSDYSKLETQVEDGVMFLDTTNRLGDFDRFIVAPCEVWLEANEDRSQKELDDLALYAHASLIGQMSEALGPFFMTEDPGPGVGYIRCAITRASPFDTQRLGHWGGITIEAEIQDSVTQEQIGAAMLSGKGGPFSDGRWNETHKTIDGWMARLRERLFDARNTTPRM